ncbi:AMP-activated serine/threonine-protein kinase regulatory subunit [Allomyces javanicus]|nr:AMP-activated serine/threonine-protein kinase regulatory subunit [Allomyces javanicus]
MTTLHEFLQGHTAYDILPVSLKVVAIDAQLPLRKAVAALLQNGLVAAPLWNSETQSFAGLLTVTDLLHLILHFTDETQEPSIEGVVDEIDHLTVEDLRHIRESHVGLSPIQIHPMHTLFDATHAMLQCHLHHVPLIDVDSCSGQDTIVSVLSGFKILKFLACNCPMVRTLTGTIGELGIGTYAQIQTVTPASMTMDAVRILADACISAVPVVDADGKLLDMLTETDVLLSVRDFPAISVWTTVAEALMRRSVDVEPVHTCRKTDTVANLFAAIQRGPKVARFVVVDENNKVEGIVSLGDLLGFVTSRTSGNSG